MRLTAATRPPDASLEAYVRMLPTIGVERAVLVQPSVYMTDHSVILDLLSAWIPDAETRTKVLVDNPARLYGF